MFVSTLYHCDMSLLSISNDQWRNNKKKQLQKFEIKSNQMKNLKFRMIWDSVRHTHSHTHIYIVSVYKAVKTKQRENWQMILWKISKMN